MIDPRTTYLGRLVISIGQIINQATVLLGSIALLVFFWGIVKYISKRGDEKGIEEAKNTIKWGLIALFVMFSVWGLVQALGATIGVNTPPGFYKPANTPITPQGGALI
jgi:hypothetical protein